MKVKYMSNKELIRAIIIPHNQLRQIEKSAVQIKDPLGVGSLIII